MRKPAKILVVDNQCNLLEKYEILRVYHICPK